MKVNSKVALEEQFQPNPFYSQFIENRHGYSFIFKNSEQPIIFWHNEKTKEAISSILSNTTEINLCFEGIKTLLNYSFQYEIYYSLITMLRDIKNECGKKAGIMDISFHLRNRTPIRLVIKFRPIKENINSHDCTWILEVEELYCNTENSATILLFQFDYLSRQLLPYKSNWERIYNQEKPLLNNEEILILSQLKMAKSKKEIASILNITESKIKYHIKRLHRLFHFKTNESLLTYLSFIGFI